MTPSPTIAFASIGDPAARADWQRLLEGFPAARVHADARWLDVLARAYGVRGAFALARDASGTVCAGLAGYDSRTPRGAQLFHSLRHGVLARDGGAFGSLLGAVEADCRMRGCIQAVVGGGFDALPGPYRASVRTAMALDLGGGPQLLWDGFRDKVRNTVRKAERSGLQVSRDLAHLRAFHAIYARAMTERRANVRALSFFRAIFDVFGDDARLYSALVDGRCCGAMVVVAAGGQAAYPFGAFDEHGRRLGANTLLLWHVARDLAGEGVGVLDLGPSAPDSGTYRFKIHVGGVPQRLHYVDLLRPIQLDSVVPSGAVSPPALGRLDRMIEHLPLALRVQARTWLGRTGRLL